jgi:hypothetical protein
MKTKLSSTKTTGKDKGSEQLKTEPPISEKDEVKKAEDRTRKATKK